MISGCKRLQAGSPSFRENHASRHRVEKLFFPIVRKAASAAAIGSARRSGQEAAQYNSKGGPAGPPGQAFSTWPNSSSTGVERPKMSTATRRRLFS